MADGGPDKDRVIDALVLAIANSELASVTGSDALRSVLRVEYHDMVEGNVFDMEQLWELLAEQPGFDPEAAKPPLALFKTWESRLELEVKLPPALEALDDRDRALAAAQCRVPPAELKLLFRMQTGESGPEASSRGRSTMPPPRGRGTLPPGTNTSGQHPQFEDKKPKPAWLGWLAIVFAIGGFSFAGYNGYQYCHPGASWDSFDSASLGAIPARSATRLGDQVTVEVDANAWNRLDLDTRHKQLKVALLSVEDRGIKVISLTAGGKPVASVQKSRGGEVVFWPSE